MRRRHPQKTLLAWWTLEFVVQVVQASWGQTLQTTSTGYQDGNSSWEE